MLQLENSKMNDLHQQPDFSAFAKTVAEMSAYNAYRADMNKMSEPMKPEMSLGASPLSGMSNLDKKVKMPTGTKGKRPLRHLTASDKIDAIQRIHDGESKASVARDIGVPESTLRGWCKNEDKLRYMSRQSQENAEKLNSEATAAALTAAAAAELFNGPAEKRMKLEPSMFQNGKLKYDDSFYKNRSPMNGLDLSGNDKNLGASGGDIIMNGFHHGLSSAKDMNMKGFGGADLSKPKDPTKSDLSMAAISPLTSLSHLSGMSGLGQSPLALSFNEIANNLNLIAQLNSNPNLAAMSGLSGLNSAAASLRNARPKTSQSPRTGIVDNNGMNGGVNDKTPSLTVRNLAKLQQKSTEIGNGMMQAINLSDKYKTTAASLGRDGNAPVNDTLWYWLKSQQAMLGLNNLYSLPRATSPQQSSSPPQQTMNQTHPSTQTPTPPIVSTPQPQPTPPSSTPSVTPEDTKNSSWFWQWYKTFGASLVPGDKQHPMMVAANNNNILYSQLTKGSTDSMNNNVSSDVENSDAKPEDLSKSNNSVDVNRYTPNSTTSVKLEVDQKSDDGEEANSGKIKENLDNLLYNNNNDDEKHDKIESNNNINDVKSEMSDDSTVTEIKSSAEALEYGEKFLKWLESCSDPNVTAMQVMQFKYLLTSLKSSADRLSHANANPGEERTRIRRRK